MYILSFWISHEVISCKKKIMFTFMGLLKEIIFISEREGVPVNESSVEINKLPVNCSSRFSSQRNKVATDLFCHEY